MEGSLDTKLWKSSRIGWDTVPPQQPHNHQNVLSFNHVWPMHHSKSEKTTTNIAPKGPFPANSRPGINKLGVGRNICEGIGVQLPRGMAKSFTNLNLSSFLGENLPESTATGVFVTWHGSSERPALHEVASGFPLWWCSTPPRNLWQMQFCSLWTSWSASKTKVGTPCQNDLQSAEGLCWKSTPSAFLSIFRVGTNLKLIRIYFLLGLGHRLHCCCSINSSK